MAVQTNLSVLLRVCESIANENQAGPIWHTFDAFSGLSLDSGTGAGQADKVWSDRRNLAGGANETLDFAGSLVQLFGGTITFAKIKALVFYNRTAGQLLTVKPAAANGWVSSFVTDVSDVLRVPAQGFVVWYDPAGTAVGAGATDSITVTNSAGSAVDYDIFVVGTSV